jgi:hypothetical protein
MSGADVTSVGRKPTLGSDQIEGYQVITMDGVRVGNVLAVYEHQIAIRSGSWPFQRLRALSVDLAVVRDVDRTVLMLASPDDLTRLSKQPGAKDPQQTLSIRYRTRIRRPRRARREP